MTDTTFFGYESKNYNLIDDFFRQLNKILPAIIESFDPELQTASVKPAINKYLASEKKFKELLVIDNVPVIFPFSHIEGLSITYPIKKGDLVMLLIPDKEIDAFYEKGEVVNPSSENIRCHDLTDAIAFPNFLSKNKKIEAFNNDAIEIKNKESDVKISLNDNDISIISGGSEIVIKDGEVTLKANSVKIDTANIDASNAILTVNDLKTSSISSINLHTHDPVTNLPNPW